MSTVDANRVILTGENSVIRLNKNDSDAFTTNATFWRLLSSPAGPGHVLYIKSELTEARWRIYSDNIAMTRWLQSTVLGAINAELRDPTMPVAEALFSKTGGARDFWTERLDARDEEIALTWYELGGAVFGAHPTQFDTGAPLWDVHRLESRPRRAADPQRNRCRRPALAEGARRSRLQHLRARTLRKLDRARIEPARIERARIEIVGTG